MFSIITMIFITRVIIIIIVYVIIIINIMNTFAIFSKQYFLKKKSDNLVNFFKGTTTEIKPRSFFGLSLL